MTVKDDRGPKQEADSHIGNSVDSRIPRRPQHDTRDTRDCHGSDSILDFVELLPDRAGFAQLATNGAGRQC